MQVQAKCSEQIMLLTETAHKRRLELERQAAAMALEYSVRSMQEELGLYWVCCEVNKEPGKGDQGKIRVNIRNVEREVTWRTNCKEIEEGIERCWAGNRTTTTRPRACGLLLRALKGACVLLRGQWFASGARPRSNHRAW